MLIAASIVSMSCRVSGRGVLSRYCLANRRRKCSMYYTYASRCGDARNAKRTKARWPLMISAITVKSPGDIGVMCRDTPCDKRGPCGSLLIEVATFPTRNVVVLHKTTLFLVHHFRCINHLACYVQAEPLSKQTHRFPHLLDALDEDSRLFCVV